MAKCDIPSSHRATALPRAERAGRRRGSRTWEFDPIDLVSNWNNLHQTAAVDKSNIQFNIETSMTGARWTIAIARAGFAAARGPMLRRSRRLVPFASGIGGAPLVRAATALGLSVSVAGPSSLMSGCWGRYRCTSRRRHFSVMRISRI
jgi:hypothetical protein